MTCTTRSIREGETDGVHYHFLDKETFRALIEEKGFFEWDQHYDHLYGSRISDVENALSSGTDVLFVIDVNGAKTISKDHPEAIVLFLKPHTEKELLERLQKRDRGDTAGFEKRKVAIEKELAYGETIKYQIVNKDGELEQAVQEVVGIMNDLDKNN